jgi:hypothetical protein
VIATPSATFKTGFGLTEDDNTSEIDISDSGILLRADKRLFRLGGGVAGGVIGLTKPDQDTDLEDDIFFHQIHTFYWNRDFQVIIGRTRLRNSSIEFPTLRDDDLLEFTHVPNASSFAENDQFQLFANQIGVDWLVDRKYFIVSAWGGARFETDVTGNREKEFNLNSAGIGLTYTIPETLRLLRWVRQVSLLLDYQHVANAPGSDDDMFALIAGAEWNLNLNPERNWSMSAQAIYNHGLDGAGITTLIGRRREQAWAVVGAIRYTARPNLLTRWQAALTIAYRDFPKQSDARQFGLAPSAVYRLGHGIDLVGQYILIYRDHRLARATGFETEHTFQIGMVFSFDATFNDTIGERRSILNLEHGFIQ